MRATLGANRIHMAFIVVVADTFLTSILYQSWASIVSAQVVYGVQLIIHAAFVWISLLLVWDTFLIKNGLIKMIMMRFRWVFALWILRLVFLLGAGLGRLSYTSMTSFWSNGFLQFIISLNYFISIAFYAAFLRMGVAAGKCSMQDPSFWKEGGTFWN